MNNKRKFDRVKALNLTFISLDDSGRVDNEGMGRTLDVSEAGILLESVVSMKKGQFLTVTIAVEEELLEMKGRVIRCNEVQEKLYHAGVEFIDIDPASMKTLSKFIKLFDEISSSTLENQ